MEIFFILVPIIMVILQNGFRIIMRKFEVLEFALDMHIGGIVLMLPLPFIGPETSEILMCIIILSATTVLLTSSCYTACVLNPRKTRYEKIGLGIGMFFFFLGLGLVLYLQ